jgi:hypothetical protein
MNSPMKGKSVTRDPVERLDEIVAELDRLYAEADHILDNYQPAPLWPLPTGNKAFN